MRRDERRQKRDVARERSLEGAIQHSAALFERFLASPDTSPSQKVVRTERVLRLAAAVEALPEDQRERPRSTTGADLGPCLNC